MYQKCDDVKVEDAEIAALVEKARGAFSAIRNMDWLEWGSDLMPEMWESIAEEERQAEFEHRRTIIPSDCNYSRIESRRA